MAGKEAKTWNRGIERRTQQRRESGEPEVARLVRRNDKDNRYSPPDFTPVPGLGRYVNWDRHSNMDMYDLLDHLIAFQAREKVSQTSFKLAHGKFRGALADNKQATMTRLDCRKRRKLLKLKQERGSANGEPIQRVGERLREALDAAV